MTNCQDKEEEYLRWQEEELRAGQREWQSNDVIVSSINWVAFVSKSKGWRNGKRRKRRHWKEVELVKYHNGWHLSRNFPWDKVAQEVLEQIYDKDGLEAEQMLRDLVPVICMPRTRK